VNSPMNDGRDYRLAIGILVGVAAGVGLMTWLAPKSASEARRRWTDSAKDLGQRAVERYERVSSRVGDTVDELARKGQNVRDDIAGAVARGAHDVERRANRVARGAHEIENLAASAQADRT